MKNRPASAALAALLLLAALAAPAPVAARPTPAPDDPAEMAAFIGQWMADAMETSHVAGATVSVVRDGEPFFAAGYGFADLETGLPVTADGTLFRIGSITKLFTWTAVMQLAEQGRLDLEADVNAYLDFRIPDTFPQPITLQHLMTHTAGFEDRNFGLAAASPEELLPLGEWLATHLPARVRAPGELAAYSNYGSALAGYIVERVSGLPFSEYIQLNILRPLRMDDTTLLQPPPADLAPRLSTGYAYRDGEYRALPFDLLQGAPMGAISSSAADMARFMLAHLEGGAGLLSPGTEARMQATRFTHDPRLNGFASGFYELSRNGERILGHGGDLGAFHSLMALLPGRRLGLFVSFNTATAMEAFLPEAFLEAFMEHYFPAPADAPAGDPTDRELLQRQVGGSYRPTRSSYTTLEKLFSQLLAVTTLRAVDDGTLLISSPYGQYRCVEIGPDLFRLEEGGDRLAFRRDLDGRVSHVFLDSDPTTAYEKLAWHQTPAFHFPLLGISLLLLLSWIGAAVVRSLRRKRSARPEASVSRLARRLLTAACWLGVLFLPALIALQGGYVYGQAVVLDLVLTLPVGMALAAGGALALALPAWRSGGWSPAGRSHYGLVVLAALADLWFLNEWNLLGWFF